MPSRKYSRSRSRVCLEISADTGVWLRIIANAALRSGVSNCRRGVLAESRSARVVGQPQFQQATKAAQVAVDAGQLFNALVVQDAPHLVAQADVTQVRGDGKASRGRHLLDGGLFVWQHGNAQVARFPCRLFLVFFHFLFVCPSV